MKRGIARTARGSRITGAGRGNKKQTNSLTAGSRVSEFSECVEFPVGFQRFSDFYEFFGVIRSSSVTRKLRRTPKNSEKSQTQNTRETTAKLFKRPRAAQRFQTCAAPVKNVRLQLDPTRAHASPIPEPSRLGVLSGIRSGPEQWHESQNTSDTFSRYPPQNGALEAQVRAHRPEEVPRDGAHSEPWSGRE